MADERSTPLNQGTNKWLQITDGGKLQTWDGVDSPAPIIGNDPLVTKTELDDKASLLSQEIQVVKDGQDAGIIGYSDKAEMDADTTQPEKTVGFVGNDTTASNNGWYRFDGTNWIETDFTTNITNINSAFALPCGSLPPILNKLMLRYLKWLAFVYES